MKMRASNILIGKIKEFEGCRLVAYRDSAGVLTIGCGHTLGVKEGMRISMTQAEEFLRFDLKTAEIGVNALDVCKTQGQFDALVDFVFNLGIGNLKRSTLLKKIKHSAPREQIQREFLRWNKAKGKVLAGLVKRRQWEAGRWAEE